MFVIVSASLAGFMVSLEAFSPRSDIDTNAVTNDPSRKTNERISDLEYKADQFLQSESAAAMSLLKEKGSRHIIVESTSFSKSPGTVTSRSFFTDAGGPREIIMYVDVFENGNRPIRSFPFRFMSTGSRQPLVSSFADQPNFSRFSLRFTHEGVDLDRASLDSDIPRLKPISPEAMLFHSDYSEAKDLLEELGYIKAKSYEPSAMFGAVRRFRADYEIQGPAFVTLRDLFALRVVSGKNFGSTKLYQYVEWSSGSGGGWMESREDFIDPEIEAESDKPAEESADRKTIYDDDESSQEEEI